MVENPLKTPHLPKTRKSLGGISSLHRRSLANSRVAPAPIEECNDDDAERSSLVASERAVATSTPHSPRQPRDSITSSPQKEHFQGCLKLYVENKITKDNAWNLQLIDFMTSMIRRHDARMENLQTASAVVDASARIYSFRVDALHYDALKMAGGLCKAAQTKRGKKDDEDGGQDEGAAGGDGLTQAVKKRKKKAKSAIATNPDVLNGDFDTNDCIDPFFERLAATPGDVTSSNRAFNASLPIHDTTLALILRTDDRFLEPIKENIPENIELTDFIKIPTKLLPPFSDSDILCEPFFGFSISNWDPDNEDSVTQVNNWVEESRLNLSQQALAFDVNAEVEPIPQEDHDDLLDEEPLAGIESEEEADVAVAACVARAVPAAAAAPSRRCDMRPSERADQRLEYSYCGAVISAWAGPQHWRLRNNRASKIAVSQRTAAVANARQPRNKRQLDFLCAGLAYDHNSPAHDYLPAHANKITISRKTLATGTTWRENNFRTPIDRGLDETHFRKLYLRQNVVMLKKKELEQSISSKENKKDDSVVVTDAHEYDLNNENDMSYCPNVVQEEGSWGNEDQMAAAEFVEQRADVIGDDDMLEPPTKVAKVYIPYAMRAKKIDMKFLKHATWKLLTSDSNSDSPKVQPTTFANIYKELPTKLSATSRDSLSVPLALLSVLHLANEKGLNLHSNEEMTDFSIEGLNPSS